MIHKEIKEYSNRQRINLTKSDGFTTGEQVIIMTAKEYGNIKGRILNMTVEIKKLESDNEVIKERSEFILNAISEDKKTKDAELKELIEVSLTPIRETHKKQVEDKDNQIKELTDQINIMQSSFNQFNNRINSLSVLDILIRKKHNEIISDFISSVWITTDNPTINADVKQVISEDVNKTG